VGELTRRRKRRSNRPAGRTNYETAADRADPIWVEVGDRRMFVVGWTSGGAPYGVFEDEMDDGINDLDAPHCDPPHDPIAEHCMTDDLCREAGAMGCLVCTRASVSASWMLLPGL